MTLVVLEAESHAYTCCVEKLRPRSEETSVNDEKEWECGVKM